LRSLSGHDHSLGWSHEHRRAPWDEQRQPLASVTANAAVGVAAATTPTAVNGTVLSDRAASGQGLGRLGHRRHPGAMARGGSGASLPVPAADGAFEARVWGRSVLKAGQVIAVSRVRHRGPCAVS
jgi:hypothetical protein